MTFGTDDSMASASEASHGGTWLATIISLMAFFFSGLSFYLSALQQADLEVFVPPVLQYARDGGGDIDVFAVPVTVTNGGANTGTILAMELTVENPTTGAEPKSKTFYSAFMGEHTRQAEAPNKSFAPISVAGRATFSDTVRFYPQGNPLPKIVQDAGDFTFTLTLTVATPSEPSWTDRVLATRVPPPLVFTRTLPYLSEQHLNFRRGSISMHAKDWKPTASAGK